MLRALVIFFLISINTIHLFAQHSSRYKADSEKPFFYKGYIIKSGKRIDGLIYDNRIYPIYYKNLKFTPEIGLPKKYEVEELDSIIYLEEKTFDKVEDDYFTVISNNEKLELYSK